MAVVQLGAKDVGSIVKLNIDGESTEFIVVHQGLPDSMYDASCDGTWLLMKDCCDTSGWGNKTYAETFSYLNSSFLFLFDEDIQAKIKQVKMPWLTWTNTTSSVLSGADGKTAKIFMLSAVEMGFTSDDITKGSDLGLFADGAKLDYFISGQTSNGSELLKRIAYLNGKAMNYWTRSFFSDSNRTNGMNGWPCFAASNGRLGNGYNWGLSTSHTLRPALILPPELLVSEDGSVLTNTVTNTGPRAPEKVTYPSTIYERESIQVLWSFGSEDDKGSVTGLTVERSTDGGKTWGVVQSASSAYSGVQDYIPAGTVSVIYRVKSYNSEGVYSNYTVGPEVMITSNAAPSAPASITVPNTISAGQTISITWRAATDKDGDSVTYILERKLYGGNWYVVYQGANTSYAEIIGYEAGWQTVAYRVRAVDSHGAYSSYVTSPTRTVNHNTPPVISCDYASGTNLGQQDGAFTVNYSVGDTDADSVSITEAIDSVTIRSFAATLGANNTFTLTGEEFMKLSNGDHTITITASDGKAATVHKLTFQKLVTSALITLIEAVPADARITVCVVSVSGDIPTDANFKVEVTNNGLDNEPTWEDCTNEVKNGANHVFENEAQTNGWAFNFKVTASRGPSGKGGYINSVQGGFQ